MKSTAEPLLPLSRRCWRRAGAMAAFTATALVVAPALAQDAPKVRIERLVVPEFLGVACPAAQVRTTYALRPTDGLGSHGTPQHRFFLRQSVEVRDASTAVVRTLACERELLPPLAPNASGAVLVDLEVAFDGRDDHGVRLLDGRYSLAVRGTVVRIKNPPPGNSGAPAGFVDIIGSDTRAAAILLDATPPDLAATATRATYHELRVEILLTFSDRGGSGIDSGTLKAAANGRDLSALLSDVTPTSARLVVSDPALLKEGDNLFTFSIADRAGNTAVARASARILIPHHIAPGAVPAVVRARARTVFDAVVYNEEEIPVPDVGVRLTRSAGTLSFDGTTAAFVDLVTDDAGHVSAAAFPGFGDNRVAAALPEYATVAPAELAVRGAAQLRLALAPAGPIEAGSAVSLSLLAVDASGAPIPEYSGIVQVHTTDARSLLDDFPVAFAGTEGGTITAPYFALFVTAGTQSIAANDTLDPGLVSRLDGIVVVPGPPRQFLAVSGVGWTTVSVGTAPPPAVVRLLDAFDNPIPGRSVDATVSLAGAADELFLARTDDQGEAQVALPAFDTPGVRQVSLRATATDLPALTYAIAAVAPQATATVGATGGTVTVTDPASPALGAGLVIPPGSLPGNLSLEISALPVSSPGLPEVPAALAAIGSVIDFGPSGAVFSGPITLVIPYREEDIPAGVPETSLVLLRLDLASGTWVPAAGAVQDTTANTFTLVVWDLAGLMCMAGAPRTPGVGPYLAIKAPANLTVVKTRQPSVTIAFSENGVPINRSSFGVMIYPAAGPPIDLTPIAVDVPGGAQVDLSRIAPLPDGVQRLTAWLADNQGVLSTATSVFGVGAAAPPTVAIDTGASGFVSSMSGPIAVRWQAPGGMKTLSAILDRGTATQQDVTSRMWVNYGSATLDLSGWVLPEGPHTLDVTIADLWGQVATVRAGFTYDATGPAVTLAVPTPPGIVVSLSPSIQITFQDPISGPDPGQVHIWINSAEMTSVFTVTTGGIFFPSKGGAGLDRPLLHYGANQIVVRVPDLAGNLTRFETAIMAHPPITLKIAPGYDVTQIGLVGRAAPQPTVVVAQDGSGQPVAGVPVKFAASAGGGDLAEVPGYSTTTQLGGLAWIQYRLPPSASKSTVTASVPEAPEVTSLAIGFVAVLPTVTVDGLDYANDQWTWENRDLASQPWAKGDLVCQHTMKVHVFAEGGRVTAPVEVDVPEDEATLWVMRWRPVAVSPSPAGDVPALFGVVSQVAGTTNVTVRLPEFPRFLYTQTAARAPEAVGEVKIAVTSPGDLGPYPDGYVPLKHSIISAGQGQTGEPGTALQPVELNFQEVAAQYNAWQAKSGGTTPLTYRGVLLDLRGLRTWPNGLLSWEGGAVKGAGNGQQFFINGDKAKGVVLKGILPQSGELIGWIHYTVVTSGAPAEAYPTDPTPAGGGQVPIVNNKMELDLSKDWLPLDKMNSDEPGTRVGLGWEEARVRWVEQSVVGDSTSYSTVQGVLPANLSSYASGPKYFVEKRAAPGATGVIVRLKSLGVADAETYLAPTEHSPENGNPVEMVKITTSRGDPLSPRHDLYRTRLPIVLLGDRRTTYQVYDPAPTPDPDPSVWRDEDPESPPSAFVMPPIVTRTEPRETLPDDIIFLALNEQGLIEASGSEGATVGANTIRIAGRAQGKARPGPGKEFWCVWLPASHHGVLVVDCPDANPVVRYGPDSTAQPAAPVTRAQFLQDNAFFPNLSGLDPLLDEFKSVTASPKAKFFVVPPGQPGYHVLEVTANVDYELVVNYFEVARARVTPWHFYFYPTRVMAAAGGPLAKYDQFFGLDWATVQFENRWHSMSGDPSWQGHCEAATVASILFQQPASNDPFTQDDMEALLTELVFDHVDNNTFPRLPPRNEEPYGALSVDSPEAKPGHTDADKLPDYLVGALHVTLRSLIGDMAQPVFADLRAREGGDGHQRWHQAVYKYISKFSQRVGTSLGPRDLRIETVFYSNEDRNIGQNWGDPDTRDARRERAEYDLSVGTDGEIIPYKADNDWMSLKNPNIASPKDPATTVDLPIPRVLGQVAPLVPNSLLPAQPLRRNNPKITEQQLLRFGVQRN